uniref:RGS domain-containing protein n=1 Tax=Lotharella globosa TaxID=91324 RepID=A0A7S3Z3W4_9EUKA
MSSPQAAGADPVELAVRRATKDLTETVKRLAGSHGALMSKITELEVKVQDLSGRLRRAQMVRKAQRIIMKKRKDAIRRQRLRGRSPGADATVGEEDDQKSSKNKKKNSPRRELRAIMSHPQSFSVFQRFCEKEDCGSYPHFYKKVHEFLDECDSTLEDLAQLMAAGLDPMALFAPPNPPDPSLQLAKTIFFDYIVQGSPHEVGLSKGLVQRLSNNIHKLLRAVDHQTLSDVRADLEDAQTEVFAFLANYTFPRFQSSESTYAACKAIIQPASRQGSGGSLARRGGGEEDTKNKADSTQSGLMDMLKRRFPFQM